MLNNYVQLSKSYADIGAYKAALAVANHGLQSLLLVAKLEEQSQHVTDHIKGIFLVCKPKLIL